LGLLGEEALDGVRGDMPLDDIAADLGRVAEGEIVGNAEPDLRSRGEGGLLMAPLGSKSRVCSRQEYRTFLEVMGLAEDDPKLTFR